MEAELQVYSATEVVAEKLRATRQQVVRLESRGWSRNRARDYYELWRVLGYYWDRLDLVDFRARLHDKCRLQNVDFEGPEDFFDLRIVDDVEKGWENSLGPLLVDLPTLRPLWANCDHRWLLSSVQKDNATAMANSKLAQAVESYLTDLRLVRASGGATDERSLYVPLANLLNAVGGTLKPKVFCVQELADQGVGHPDFGLYSTRQVQKGRPKAGQKPERGVIEVNRWPMMYGSPRPATR